MTNFPSKWLEFSNYKELKRLRSDVNNTFSLKLQIASSIILAIISFFIDSLTEDSDESIRALVCIFLCLFVALIFAGPYILKQIRIRRHCNVIIKGKDAISIFDEEIIYNVLVAHEYFNIRNTTSGIPSDKHMREFYNIEISYYIDESITHLSKFLSNTREILGYGKNQLSPKRVKNICDIIQDILKDQEIALPQSQIEKFNAFYETVVYKISN